MKVIYLSGSSKLQLKRTCAAIGIFDGVHLGHQYLIKKMLTVARRLKAQPIVITFFPHPAHVLRPDVKLGYLNSLQDRFRLLSRLGVAACVVIPFNRSFARIQPEKFIKNILIEKLGVKAIFVGDDFKFGRDRKGDIPLFQSLALEYDYRIYAVGGLKQGRDIISSTRIRKLIGEGKLNAAEQLLGRPVSVSGEVIKGSQRGKSLGYATANIAYESNVLPTQGVYAVRILIGKNKYNAVANLGTRPSFDKQISKLHLEVHIFNFSKNIYGKHVEVEFLRKIRNEKKFETPQRLIQQIQKDEVLVRKFFALGK